jgi:predicted nucleic acid-binding Zn ribbon protein
VTDPDPGDQVRLAREAVAAAKASARAKGLRPTATPRQQQPTPGTDVGQAPGRDGEQAAPRPGPLAGPASRAGDGVSDGPVPGLAILATTPGGATTGAATTGDGPPDAAPPDGGSPPGAPPGPVPPGPGPDKTAPAGGSTRRGPQRWSARPGFAAQPQRSDPQALGAAINGLLDAEGWALAAATGSVFGRWPQIVGADLAAHTNPETLADGELTISADSTAWATQVRLLAAQLVRRLNAELGDGTVRRVRVRGPATTTRKPGEWRVRGGRGPRDTYG